jgi:hypothetical protein
MTTRGTRGGIPNRGDGVNLRSKSSTGRRIQHVVQIKSLLETTQIEKERQITL